jgi:Mg2+ and Co2+ transporter CorA
MTPLADSRTQVENLLDLKQKQANVDESRLARWEAEVTQTQSRSVMVFTIFTVIFLPLSFFTSLFGINVREWSGTETNPDFRQIFLIAGKGPDSPLLSYVN